MQNYREINLQSYLDSLINFILKRIHIIPGEEKEDKDEDKVLSILSSTFFQPFKALSNDDESGFAEQKVSQARIAIEVLRRYVDDQSKASEYLESAYRILLNGIGTSYDEIRLLTEDDTERLASRLGLKSEHIEKLRLSEKPQDTLPENTLTESRLESLFGLQSTLGNAIRQKPDSAEIINWQQDALRAAWLKQDKQILTATTQIPIIDPDIISENDIKSVTGNPVYELRKIRKAWIDEQKGEIQKLRKPEDSQQKNFTKMLHHVLGEISLSALLEDDLKGIDIEPRLSNAALTMGDLRELLKLEQLSIKNTITDREWLVLDELLTQIQKIRKKFKKQEQEGELTWAEEELSEGHQRKAGQNTVFFE